MGSINFVIIPSLKIAVEVRRDVDEIEEYIVDALDKLTREDIYNVDCTDAYNILGEKEVTRLTIKDLATLYTVYEAATSLADMDLNKFLLYWLTHKGIPFEIKSEYNIDRQKLHSDGYVIIPLYKRDDNEE